MAAYDSFAYTTVAYSTEATVITKNFTADMVLMKESLVAKTAAVSTVFEKLNVETDFPLDMAIAKVITKTTTVDVIIAKETAKTATSDMVIAREILRQIFGAYSSGSYSPVSYTVYDMNVLQIDMVIEKLDRIAKALPVDVAIALEARTNMSLSAVIELLNVIKTMTSDIVIQKTDQLKQILLQVVMEKLNALKTFPLDIIIAKEAPKTVTVDMVMVKDQSNDYPIDLYVRRVLNPDLYVRRVLNIDLYVG